jgi:hypothetical protein
MIQDIRAYSKQGRAWKLALSPTHGILVAILKNDASVFKSISRIANVWPGVEIESESL